MKKKTKQVVNNYSTSWDMYEVLNRMDVSYVECEGDKCIRADFNDYSVWFDMYDSERSIRGSAPMSQKKELQAIAKKYNFVFAPMFMFQYR